MMAQGIKGLVVGENNQPLEGATVYNMKKGIHEHTNENGHFYLRNSQVGDSITITHISFFATTLRAHTADKLRLLLCHDKEELDRRLAQFEIIGELRDVQKIIIEEEKNMALTYNIEKDSL